MNDLRRRTATAVVYGVVVLAAALAPIPVFWALLAVAAVLSAAELAGLRAARAWGVLALLVCAGLVSLGVLRVWGPEDAHHGTADGLPVWIFFVLVPMWAADVTAYLVGSTAGRRRIVPRISPGKTWEGTIAGFAACTVVAIGLAALFGLPKAESIALAGTLGPIGFAGDLVESYVKRGAGVKDSGSLFPGHGGILDRLDSVVAAATVVAIVVAVGRMAQPGGASGLLTGPGRWPLG